ncbi:metalloendopeptidase-like membrane protein [Synechococcus sp. PCC 7502]|uniref:LysM peptidoglycan-binding domain-containing M23 family metallopeptidase n=1 Tax=Synechococcus sp. PCC 7502 TaxID=1173263 RepID=UPI00029FF42B|nr:M23 family metallopeptidase [Synechococcus sp. PCC 7502]AFY74602.1 metalloendopeptidase-like membrane protein [Synechococcus sp. PCC 7502]
MPKTITNLTLLTLLGLTSLAMPAIATSNPPINSSNPNTSENSSGTDNDVAICGNPILASLKDHKVKAGETLDSIAKQYNLTTATLMGLNPQNRDRTVKVGQVLKIPPMDGFAYELKNQDTYKIIADKYRVRPDVIFEFNGCQNRPKTVFIPGAMWKPDPIIAKIIPPNIKETVILQTGGYPLPYPVPVTSGYGWRNNPVTGQWSFHSGIDLGASMGTPVLAAKNGIVEFAGWEGGYGNFIEIIHNSFGTRYAHLSQIYVTPGQRVVRGQEIGRVGSTGRSTGPHLHFEVMVPSSQGWATLDPASYLIRLAVVLGEIVAA